MIQLRKPAVAGLFYPADPQKLESEIKQHLKNSIPSFIPSKVFGLVSPHAGYVYSGSSAAYGFNTLQNKKFKTVIIISPSHKEYFPGVSIYNGDAYETPLGEIPIDQEISDLLVDNKANIFRGINGHRDEHAIEVQLPFLQYVLEDFSIVPIVMGDQSKIFIDALADKLKEVVNEYTLLIASSDLSHYYSADEAEEKDSRIERSINEYNIEQFVSDISNKKCEACGAGPILSVMKSVKENNKNKSLVLNRTHSGYVSGDYDQVVGYLSAVFYGE
ncbi:MAG: AmmeMemoRadiSam system protein B [Ignavibacteriales bacterium CG12_big_fil_rev_8_21_14_0_65_30_8]|nr:MAG: AmmeMemoRadiSam system protein B [Ignavibacteriales bacterium CG12_big_fil_rev_8_21_14_0_65_30_8]